MFCKICKQSFNTPHNQEQCHQHLQYYGHILHKGKTEGWHTVIDFTMTACNRPELIKPTCESLGTQLKDLQLSKATIYCNLDPLQTPDEDDKVKETLEKYFGTVVMNKPKNPSFPKAVKWCWTQSTKPLTFHTEDDWHFMKPFKMEDLFKMMIPYNFISSVQLYKGEHDKGLNGLLRLSPSLHKTVFIKQMAKLMNNTENPEKQLRHPTNMSAPGTAAIFLGLCYKPGNRYVQDIGIVWRKQRNINHTTFFKSWNELSKR